MVTTHINVNKRYHTTWWTQVNETLALEQDRKENPSRTDLGLEKLSPEQDWLLHEYNIMVMTMT